MNNIPEFYAKDRSAWRQWLQQNHATQQAVWLVFDKGKSRTLAWSDIVQEALCFGWIDGRAGSVSDTQTKLYISKRKPKSVWSKINKNYITTLIVEGRMHSAGLEAVATAKANGSWDALNKSDNLEHPKELDALLAAHPIAKQNYDTFSASAKKVMLEWIYSAKRPETRTKRIEKVVEMAAQGKRAIIDPA